MLSQRVRIGVFVVEGLNSFVVTFYFYYFYFFTHTQFGFDNKANLIAAAASGLACVPAAVFGGRFAQRAGYFTALKVGISVMFGALSCGVFLAGTAAAHVAAMIVFGVGMCFTWAPLEALVSEGETYARLQHNIGIYNVVWASTSALAYFTGGAILDRFGLKSLFFVPMAILATQLAMTFLLHRAAKRFPHVAVPAPAESLRRPDHKPEHSRAFLRMAWLANPFSYIAVNTLVAVVPGVAARLNLSTTLAGFCCSAWCFARLGAFFGLWLWPGWHYRFRWLLTAYLVLITSFVAILRIPNLATIIAAQILFGSAVGLIYYSSLFYSMDVGDTKGEHGGLHEATIGLGNFAGPALGAASLQFYPQYTTNGALAVGALLMCGLGGLLAIWRRMR